MKRLVTAIAAVSIFAALIPSAGAHPSVVADGANDAVRLEESGIATALDISSATFNDTKKTYVITVDMHAPVTTASFCSAETGCGEPWGMGVLSSDFYVVKKDVTKNYYFVEAYSTETGLVGNLYNYDPKTHEVSFVGNVPVTLDATGTQIVFTVPRNKLNGQKKGMNLLWNVRSTYWNSAGSETCAFDPAVDNGGACIDWVPDAADLEHKLKK